MKPFHAVLLLFCAVSCSTTESGASTPSRSAPALKRELTVGVVLVAGAHDTELAAHMDVFHRVASHAHPAMAVLTIGATRDPVKTASGMLVTPDWTFASAPSIDVLVVPGTLHGLRGDLELAPYIEFVAEHGRSARFVVSAGNGSAALAAAGLLDGHRSVAAPADLERMHERFPKLRVSANEPFLHDGTVITSQGGACAYDAALYVVELVYGNPVSRAIEAELRFDGYGTGASSQRSAPR